MPEVIYYGILICLLFFILYLLIKLKNITENVNNLLDIRKHDIKKTVSPVVTDKKKLFDEIPFNPNNKNILIVEDSVELCSVIYNSLKNVYNTYYAFNGIEALNELDKIPVPDLIISDIFMPEMDGFEFFESIKEEDINIPFIFLSENDSEDNKIKSFKKGAIAYIVKPFKTDELILRINSIINFLTVQKEKIFKEFKNKLSDVIKKRDNSFEIDKQYKRKYSLSNREMDVVEYLINGVKSRHISEKLNISLSTVNSHIASIYRKCGVNNKIELINTLKKI